MSPEPPRRRTIAILTAVPLGDCDSSGLHCLYAVQPSQSQKCLKTMCLASALLRRELRGRCGLRQDGGHSDCVSMGILMVSRDAHENGWIRLDFIRILPCHVLHPFVRWLSLTADEYLVCSYATTQARVDGRREQSIGGYYVTGIVAGPISVRCVLMWESGSDLLGDSCIPYSRVIVEGSTGAFLVYILACSLRILL
jgi:hypothetical protein